MAPILYVSYCIWHRRIKHLPTKETWEPTIKLPRLQRAEDDQAFSPCYYSALYKVTSFQIVIENIVEMNMLISLTVCMSQWGSGWTNDPIYRTDTSNCHRVKIIQILVPLLGFISLFLDCLSFGLVLGTKFRALGMLDKCSIVDLCSQTLN